MEGDAKNFDAGNDTIWFIAWVFFAAVKHINEAS